MTREEQIIQASEIFSTNDLLSFGGTCEELDYGFREGAKWADKNPINVWHDASETPKKNRYILIEVVITLTPKNVIGYYVEYTENTVVKIMKTEGLRCRWAYISDLLTKGGEK